MSYNYEQLFTFCVYMRYFTGYWSDMHVNNIIVYVFLNFPFYYTMSSLKIVIVCTISVGFIIAKMQEIHQRPKL